jgi:polar amino acid transport system substrate-binding protein
MEISMRFFSVILLALLVTAAHAADPALAPTATLRAAYIVSNVAQARRDPATGSIAGVIADITHELGRRAGVPVTITPAATAAVVIEAVRNGAADIGFVAPNPERTGLVLYSQTYMLVQQSALVRADSALRSVSELDRAGHVIGVNTDDSVSVWLKQLLTEARLRATPDFSLREGVQWLNAREVVAFAGGRARLLSATRDVAGLRMLDDNFYGVPQAIAVPLDRSERLQAINAALAEMKQSGFLAEVVKRSGVDGIAPAP